MRTAIAAHAWPAHNGSVQWFPVVGLFLALSGAAPSAALQPARGAMVRPAMPRAVATPVDINRAPLSALLRIPGMTRVWAERIVRFRPYRTKRDLVEEGVLPAPVYSKIEDYVIAHRVKP
jgi:hypothetical protein